MRLLGGIRLSDGQHVQVSRVINHAQGDVGVLGVDGTRLGHTNVVGNSDCLGILDISIGTQVGIDIRQAEDIVFAQAINRIGLRLSNRCVGDSDDGHGSQSQTGQIVGAIGHTRHFSQVDTQALQILQCRGINDVGDLDFISRKRGRDAGRQHVG